MNSVALMGRLTKDPEVKMTQSGTSVAAFTLAVDRRYKKEGQPTADFINCLAWKNLAEHIAKYFHKGERMAITGSIQTRSWEGKDGKKNYATEVVVDTADFCESKKQEEKPAGNTEAEFYPADDDDLPF